MSFARWHFGSSYPTLFCSSCNVRHELSQADITHVVWRGRITVIPPVLKTGKAQAFCGFESHPLRQNFGIQISAKNMFGAKRASRPPPQPTSSNRPVGNRLRKILSSSAQKSAVL